ncbi:MAG: B12-binding domain-containing radical SAM protein [Desulfovibrionaceae bacterium]|nr:B12-binding domain-containing radical SAM protein [Desulfovibrionaceae bacterium]
MYDVLLINAHRQYEIQSGILCDWLGVYLLASYMAQNGFPARAFAGFAHEVVPLLEEEMDKGVKVVGFSCDYENQSEVLQFSRLVRERWHVPVIVGGPQAVALGGPFLQASGALAVVRGEGELPLLGLMQHLVDGCGELKDIEGIVFLDNGKERVNPPPPLITDLDALPFIDPSLVLGKRFRVNTASFLTARGCPFRCSFCYEGGNTRAVRWRSVDNVMAEVRQVLESNPHIRFILFTDDTFTLNVKRVLEFTSALSEYRAKRDFSWFAEAHPQTIVKHPEIIQRMVEAGLGSLQIGVESGEERVLRAYNKKTTPRMVEEAVHICREASVPFMVANIIVGGAFETEESVARTKEFALGLLEKGAGMLELYAVHFWPLPHTAMTERPCDFGMEVLDPQSLTAVTDYPVVRCGKLSPERLSALRFDMGAAFAQKIRDIAQSLPIETVHRILQYWYRYNLHSGYVDALLSTTRYRRFVVLLEDGVIRRACDVPRSEIALWHPQRQCMPITRNGQHFAEDLPIDDEAYRVLVASAGRMTVAEAAAFCGMTQEDFLSVAQRLEDVMALAFCRF